MNMIPFTCPNCGGQLNVADGKSHMRCGWCGSDLLITPDKSGGSVDVRLNVNINIERDEARIREADVSDHRDERNNVTKRLITKTGGILGVLYLIAFIVLIVFAHGNEATMMIGGMGLLVAGAVVAVVGSGEGTATPQQDDRRKKKK